MNTGHDGEAEIPPSAAYRISLPEFEGPLDLLLHLCRQHEINILDISISFVTEKYLEYLDRMQSISVEIAAEYLVMAAHLAYLKSRELVPSPEPLEAEGDGEESGLDPREELIRQLLEYAKYKDAAAQLGGRPIEGRNVFLRGRELQGDSSLAPLAEHSPWKLIEHFAELLKKSAPKHTHDVATERVTVSHRINQIVDKLEAGGGSFRFDTLIDFTLPEFDVRQMLVVTLLAILELAKLRAIRVLQDPATEAFFITQADGAGLAEARRVTATADAAPIDEPTDDQPAAEAEDPDGNT